ncbi:MAG: hypothetical protein SOU09_05895 [Faecalimonas umbilicata]|uniref:hypothetical protein n=1 Tax=Faecalimonas umbilicata TaxID=1912855 RepID=UPI002A74FA89|nr:hypothetical protein [Faecalimonas umbilicata]MDY2761592.1 hypothetical protein [Faecalimonas umbilicata]
MYGTLTVSATEDLSAGDGYVPHVETVSGEVDETGTPLTLDNGESRQGGDYDRKRKNVGRGTL